MWLGRCLRVSCVLVGLSSAQASAATMGLWLMDTMGDTNPGAPGGETIYDSSGSNRHIVSGAAVNVGNYLALTSDRPAVMPPGTMALDTKYPGYNYPSVASTNAFHRGLSGELTVEFWFKYKQMPGSPVAYLLNYGPDGNPGRWAIYADTSGNMSFFEGSGSAVNTGTLVANGAWHHVGFSVNAAGISTAYVDGVQVSQNSAAGAAAAPTAQVLKVGRNPTDGLVDLQGIFDELRISNVALLPGNGSGVGELGWNASFVPEPASVGAALMVGAGLLARRRGC